MAPVEQTSVVDARDLRCGVGWDWSYSQGQCVRYNSGWLSWGRWVLAGLIVLSFIVMILLLARNSRRRRRLGHAPLRGTGWMAPAPPYYPNQAPPQYSPAPPVYPQGTGQKFNQTDGYYANHQQDGIQLQQPQNTYQPAQQYGGEGYAPPDGPPPKRT